METENKANNRRLFLGENGGPLRLCSRRIDKGGGWASITVTNVLITTVVLSKFVLCLVAQW